MEEDIKVIKEQIYTVDGEKMNYIDIDNVIDNECDNFIKAIENLIKGYKELEKLSENIKMFRDNNLSSEIDYVIALKSNFMEYLKTDYILKSKVREKIEELDDIESDYSKKIIEAPTNLVTGVVQYAFKEPLQEGR